ncbi:MAG: 3-methyl-2-oxobutanoate dehydrogenase subunit VorB [Erysipelotrichia bacterium]|jgi:2-oxoglutarate ferredoxin oxidoreductase subunit alpha|nr:3-methyl-2-oxobutanoate dehydrogenase subunit VorB [Erysipelotrichia bacterium]
MSEVEFLKGNEAIAKAALNYGVQAFFGYPITPQNELIEAMSNIMPEHGRVFVQAESEVAAINMVYGAAGAGGRVMTSSSSVGIALKQEGISYCAGAELPCVIVSVSRSGPGLGGILPAQSDYHQSVYGGGNGDYRVIVLAPASVQEAVDDVGNAIRLSEKYRNPAMVLLDGAIAQMMASVTLPSEPIPLTDHSKWAATGQATSRGSRNIINSLYLDPTKLYKHNQNLQEKYREIARNEAWLIDHHPDHHDGAIIAYGTSAKIALGATQRLKDEHGLNVKCIQLRTLWPFPKQALKEALSGMKFALVAEMSMGQLFQDVLAFTRSDTVIGYVGKAGGEIITSDDIVNGYLKQMGGEQIEHSV